jgi:hypothetical protein
MYNYCLWQVVQHVAFHRKAKAKPSVFIVVAVTVVRFVSHFTLLLPLSCVSVCFPFDDLELINC